ncbi:terpene cyclase/mutase family protein [Kiritimatiellaeota bacterium B1221]|nr:terpene cyclase/mutase family protein [Kiritimatiellaeota bacterium B1221]
MKSKILPFLVSILLLSSFAQAQLSESVRREGEDAVRRSLKWMESKQKPGGYWSSPEWPALTGFAVWSMAMSGDYRESEALNDGVTYLKSHVQDNGGIYVEPKIEFKGGGKSNYNTAVCMVALHLTGREDVRDIVLNARNFVAAGQHLGGDVYHGGFGYDSSTKRAYADLSNTYIAIEALEITEGAEDFRTQGEKAEIDKKTAEEFISKIQNRKESNDAEWVSETPENKGGFAYHPEESKAGTIKADDGTVYFRSFGSMTYAGLLSLIYADVDRNDPRVKSAIDWTTRHWTLDENPGMGSQGYYYFLNVLSKALAVYGQDQLIAEDGTKINWRQELVKKLVSMQKIDEDGNGYWVNEENRFWEADPVLVTGYTLIALQVALQE